MSDETCFSSLQLCALRVTRLDSEGYVAVGTNNAYETGIAVSLQVDGELVAGTDVILENGCVKLQATFFDCEKVKRLGLNLELTQLDSELVEMLTGATLITTASDSIGFWLPATDAACPAGIALEAWTRRWDGHQVPVGSRYWRWGFARTIWRLGQVTMQNDIMRVPLVGTALPNDHFANGPVDDWPVDIPHNSLGGVFADDEAPVSRCGRLTTSSFAVDGGFASSPATLTVDGGFPSSIATSTLNAGGA